MPSAKAKRAAMLLASSFGGIAVGLAGDHCAGDVGLSVGNVVLAILLSPVVVPFGWKAIVPSQLAYVFMVGGLLFWPVYGYLGWRCVRKADSWSWLAILLWCAQGFFQVVHRLELVLSA